jgi:hypothetical protein
VAPEEAITGSIRARFLRYRGVVLIGATFRPTGAAMQPTPVGNSAPGRNILQISFDNRDSWDSKLPFIFLGNIDFRAGETKWGDFLRYGTKRSADGFNHKQWARLLLQKIRVSKGHYGWSVANNDNVTHSDFIQAPFGGISGIRVYDCDIAWSYQTFFTRIQAPWLAHPTAVHKFRRVVTRHMSDDPEINVPGRGRTRYVLNAMRYLEDLEAGRYQTHRINDWYIVPQPDGNGDIVKGFQLVGLTPSVVGDRLRFEHSSRGDALLPLVDGSFRLDAPPDDVAPADQIGWQRRVATAAELRSIRAAQLLAGVANF